MCMEIEPRRLLATPTLEIAPQLGGVTQIGEVITSKKAESVEVSVKKVLSTFSCAKPLAEATPIFGGHDFMLDTKMSSWEKAYLTDVEQFIDSNAMQEVVTGEMCQRASI
jgi:hypothetical protein